jgi:hypothetical protein
MGLTIALVAVCVGVVVLELAVLAALLVCAIIGRE